WNTDSDINLAGHLIFMFEKSKRINVQNLTTNEFIHIWAAFVNSEEYYQQILSYIVNADDYKTGDRFSPNEGLNEFRDSNYMKNTINRWDEFKRNNLKKQQYYSTIFSFAYQLNHVIMNRN